MTCLPLHPDVQEATDWAALMGYIGGKDTSSLGRGSGLISTILPDLGTGTKWGQAPWPAHIAVCSRK